MFKVETWGGLIIDEEILQIPVVFGPPADLEAWPYGVFINVALRFNGFVFTNQLSVRVDMRMISGLGIQIRTSL